MTLSIVFNCGLEGLSRRFLTIPVTHNFARNILVGRQKSMSIQRLLSNDVYSPPTASKLNTQEPGPTENFITIYKFPDIKYISLINRGQRFYTNAFPFALMISYGTHFVGITPASASFAVAVIGVILGIHIHLLARLTKNVIGFVYTSQDMATVQIAYVDFMGKRKDDIFPTNDIIPLSETPASVTDKFYLKVLRYSKPQTEFLKLDLKRGQIIDKDCFKKIFGSLDIK
ncbi:transmembrane protein 186 [Frankliniella occidentalis]|uniref:Transmembrane protein 186 n=1 Tax=Frankliniella occidentalis TaxID=133901 RepID=A0A6J1S3I8_FRAOC|nr:transmembrane protein 186 [Frankliniella occidentalis]XP_026273740.1 transmembrane protein 186 [Frankliniella occidentalis]XP_052127263.1 transmembrane protein 186 [Frankliniella occidentalis]